MRRRIVTVFVLASGVLGGGVCLVGGEVVGPGEVSAFDSVFHFPPVDQGRTSVCWSFSTVSFLETEMARLGLARIKLAVMYPVYYGWVEKARYFVQTKGQSRFSPGDLFPTVLDAIQKYGIVPEASYSGRPDAQEGYNHNAMYRELREYRDRDTGQIDPERAPRQAAGDVRVRGALLHPEILSARIHGAALAGLSAGHIV